MVIKFNNDLYSVFKMEHRTPGNLRGFVQAKMRNFKTGTMIEHRFSSEDKVEKAALDEHYGSQAFAEFQFGLHGLLARSSELTVYAPAGAVRPLNTRPMDPRDAD